MFLHFFRRRGYVRCGASTTFVAGAPSLLPSFGRDGKREVVRPPPPVGWPVTVFSRYVSRFNDKKSKNRFVFLLFLARSFAASQVRALSEELGGARIAAAGGGLPAAAAVARAQANADVQTASTTRSQKIVVATRWVERVCHMVLAATIAQKLLRSLRAEGVGRVLVASLAVGTPTIVNDVVVAPPESPWRREV